MELDAIFTASVFASAIRLATPYIFAALGETFTQRSGILNLGVDGMMLMGAFTGFYAVFITQKEGILSEPLSLLFGVLVALIVGGLMGLAMAFVSVTLKAKQGISGIGVYLFGAGLERTPIPAMGGNAEGGPRVPTYNFCDLVGYTSARPDLFFITICLFMSLLRWCRFRPLCSTGRPSA